MSVSGIARRVAGAIGAGALVAGSLFAMTVPASAEVNPYCSNVSQIGSTAYLRLDGEIAASVKQFIGCGKNWGYTYVWQGYRADHSDWTVCSAVRAAGGMKGNRCDYGSPVEVWSHGTDTLSVCTHGVGKIFAPGNQFDEAWSSRRC